MPRLMGKDPMPVHPFFIGFGGTLLMSALFSDWMYCENALMQWANFSTWLITGGLVLALIAVIVLLVELALRRLGPVRWLDLMLLGSGALLSVVNVLVHTRDAWTSVVPTGITLSLIASLLLLIAGLRGWRVTEIKAVGVGEVR